MKGKRKHVDARANAKGFIIGGTIRHVYLVSMSRSDGECERLLGLTLDTDGGTRNVDLRHMLTVLRTKTRDTQYGESMQNPRIHICEGRITDRAETTGRIKRWEQREFFLCPDLGEWFLGEDTKHAVLCENHVSINTHAHNREEEGR